MLVEPRGTRACWSLAPAGIAMEKLVGIASALVAASVLAAVPNEASACGGTFCDAPPPDPTMGDPQEMRVDQTGETIVFAFDETHVEAHVQINYDPDTPAERFAWIVPVMAEPEISVGSQALFLNLQNATAPSFGYVDLIDGCGGGGGGGGGGWDDDWDGDGWGGDGDYCGASGGGGDDGGWGGGNEPGDGAGDGTGGDSRGGEDGNTDGGGVEVVQQQTVGAFDFVLLQAENTKRLMQWLEDNEYFADPAAVEIIDEYLAEGAMFAAFRLSNQAGVGEIHPITIRYAGAEPCVPIRLTRIASAEEMDMRIFFLGDSRAYPSNYRHIELNPLKLDWIQLGVNYEEVVALALDAEGSDGHGFVTEYFGGTEVVARDGLEYPLVDEEAYRSIEPKDLLPLLEQQGLSNGCDDLNGCDYTHPLVAGIVSAVLPVPEGVEALDFYACPECFEEQIDLERFDTEYLATAIGERIRKPAVGALGLLANNGYVTRMYTKISPHEMTVDPFFHLSGDLQSDGLVDMTADIVTRNVPCSGRRNTTLPDGRYVELPLGTWPDIAPDEMPWVQLIEERPGPDMPPITLVDNTMLIDELLDAHNLEADKVDPQPKPRFRCDDYDPSQDGSGASGGCGCRAPGAGGAGWMLMALGLGLGFASRRRRR